MRLRAIALCGLCVLGSLFSAGCTAATDRLVSRHMGHLESDLRFRGTLERASIERQFETFRVAKRADIDRAHNDALAALDSLGKLDAAAARKASDRFTAMHRELDRLVDSAKAAAIEQARWYDLAADTVAAEQQYQDSKSQAWIEGGRAALEAFGTSYAASKRDPADATDARAQGLMEQLQAQLRELLASRLSVVTAQ